jgi:mRNA interferase MazF
MRSEIYERYDVVVVPFPFTDRQSSKRRPALVISSGPELQKQVGHSILAMITSEETPSWPNDVSLKELQKAGLSRPCKVRMKIFTLDDRLILSKIGTLSEMDQKAIHRVLKKILGMS